MIETTQNRGALLFFVALVFAAGAATMLFLPEPLLGATPATTAFLVAAATLVGTRPVRISALKIEMVPFHPFILIALGLSGIRAAGLVAVAGIIATAISRRPAAIRFVFNLGAITLSVVTAGVVAHFLGGSAGTSVGHLVAPLVAAAIVFFSMSSTLVAVAIALEQGEALLPTWNRSLRWTFWPNLAAVTIAIAAISLFDSSRVSALAVTLAPCWLLILFYRLEASRHGSEPVAIRQIAA